MPQQIILPPYSFDDTLEFGWGTPNQGKAVASADKADGFVLASADPDLRSNSGASARAIVGIRELGPPTHPGQMQVIAVVSFTADWYVALAGDPAATKGWIGLQIIDDTGALVGADTV